MPRCSPSHVRVFFGTGDNENVRLLRAWGQTAPVLFVYPSGMGAKWCLAELRKLGAHRPAKRWPWGVFFLVEAPAVVEQVQAVIARTMRVQVELSRNAPPRDIASELLSTFADDELVGVEEEE